MEKKPNFFTFKMANSPKNKTHSDAYQAFYSRYNAFIEMKMTLHLMTNKTNNREKERFVFWQHFGRTITLTVFSIPVVSTESQVLNSFIIKVRMDTSFFFYFLISF